jgi:hypothetical protein
MSRDVSAGQYDAPSGAGHHGSGRGPPTGSHDRGGAAGGAGAGVRIPSSYATRKSILVWTFAHTSGLGTPPVRNACITVRNPSWTSARMRATGGG